MTIESVTFYKNVGKRFKKRGGKIPRSKRMNIIEETGMHGKRLKK